jgi:hypothetical protein
MVTREVRVVNFLSTRRNSLLSSLTSVPPMVVDPCMDYGPTSSRARCLVLENSVSHIGPMFVYNKLLNKYFDTTIKRIIFKN